MQKQIMAQLVLLLSKGILKKSYLLMKKNYTSYQGQAIHLNTRIQ